MAADSTPGSAEFLLEWDYTGPVWAAFPTLEVTVKIALQLATTNEDSELRFAFVARDLVEKLAEALDTLVDKVRDAIDTKTALVFAGTQTVNDD